MACGTGSTGHTLILHLPRCQQHLIVAMTQTNAETRARWVAASAYMLRGMLEITVKYLDSTLEDFGMLEVHHLNRPQQLSTQLIDLLEDLFAPIITGMATIHDKGWRLCSRWDQSFIIMPCPNDAFCEDDLSQWIRSCL